MITGHVAMPHPLLRSHVWEYFGVEFDLQFVSNRLFTIVPDGGIKLMFYRAPKEESCELQIIGAHTQHRTFLPTSGSAYWAVQFVPGTAATWLPGLTNCAMLRNTQCPAEDIAGAWAGALCVQLQRCNSFEAATKIFEVALMQLLPPARPLDIEVMRAVEKIVNTNGECENTQLAAHIGLCERQLLRRFTRAVGLSPKQFARAWRVFKAVMRAVRSSEICWSAIAAELGFADQSHLNHEFTALVGHTPHELAQIPHDAFYGIYDTEPKWEFGDEKGAT